MSSAIKSNKAISLEVSTPTAAGIPVWEIIRHLEEDHIIKKDDREALNHLLQNASRRDKVLKALCDVELGVNTMFAIKRLKTLLHQQQSDDHIKKVQEDRKLYNSASSLSLPSIDSHSSSIITNSYTTEMNGYRLPQQLIPIKVDTVLSNKNGMNMIDTTDTQEHLLTNDSNNITNTSILSSISYQEDSNGDNDDYYEDEEDEYDVYDSQSPLKASPSNKKLNGSPYNNNNNNNNNNNYNSNNSNNRKMLLTPQQNERTSTSLSSDTSGHRQQQQQQQQQSQQYRNSPLMYSRDSKKSRRKSILLPNGEETWSTYDTRSTIQQVVGISPVYSQPSNLHFWSKLKMNLDALLLQYHTSIPTPTSPNVRVTSTRAITTTNTNTTCNSTAFPFPSVNMSNPPTSSSSNITNVYPTSSIRPLPPSNLNPPSSSTNSNSSSVSPAVNLKLGIIVGTGSFNPLTRMHLRNFQMAKRYLEVREGYHILGALLSPAHYATVRERYRTNISEIIPSPHRLAIAQLMVEESQWMSIDPWEITRRRAMDYVSLLTHMSKVIDQYLHTTNIRIFYLCKPNMVPRLSTKTFRDKNRACICVCRPLESDILNKIINKKWNQLLYIVEDDAILDSSMDAVTSRHVRDKIKQGKSIDYVVGRKVEEYVVEKRLGAKMNGLEPWEEYEKTLPTIPSRNTVSSGT